MNRFEQMSHARRELIKLSMELSITEYSPEENLRESDLQVLSYLWGGEVEFSYLEENSEFPGAILTNFLRTFKRSGLVEIRDYKVYLAKRFKEISSYKMRSLLENLLKNESIYFRFDFQLAGLSLLLPKIIQEKMLQKASSSIIKSWVLSPLSLKASLACMLIGGGRNLKKIKVAFPNGLIPEDFPWRNAVDLKNSYCFLTYKFWEDLDLFCLKEKEKMFQKKGFPVKETSHS